MLQDNEKGFYDGSRLTTDTAFAIDRSNENFNMEKGLSAAIGSYDFEINERR